MPKTSPVVHFEMGYNDRERMKKFYATVFGWKMRQYACPLLEGMVE